MASMIEVLLIVDDIDKELFIPLKSGKRGYRATALISDEVDKFGNNVSAWAAQSKEERDSKAHRKYLGNGKCFWSDGKVTVVTKDNPNGKVVSDNTPTPNREPAAFTEENDNLPF